jgi:hypothetical protein
MSKPVIVTDLREMRRRHQKEDELAKAADVIISPASLSADEAAAVLSSRAQQEKKQPEHHDECDNEHNVYITNMPNVTSASTSQAENQKQQAQALFDRLEFGRDDESKRPANALAPETEPFVHSDGMWMVAPFDRQLHRYAYILRIDQHENLKTKARLARKSLQDFMREAVDIVLAMPIVKAKK